MTDTSEFNETPAILELFGHQIFSGRVSETNIAGGNFIRLDVPEVDGVAGFTKYYSPSAIYGITPTDEATMIELVRRFRKKPVNLFSIIPSIPSLPGEDGENDSDQ